MIHLREKCAAAAALALCAACAAPAQAQTFTTYDTGSSSELHKRDPSGRVIRYLAPRILPFGSTVASGRTTTVGAAEVNRLDLIAQRTLGDVSAAWRIADANDAIDPFELVRAPGETLNLPAGDL